MGVAHRIREFFTSEDLTLRQVVFRSRVAFVVFVIGMAAIVQWSSSYQHGQHVRDVRTNRSLRETNRKLRADERGTMALALRVERERAKNTYTLAVLASESCQSRNEQRDRIVWTLASMGLVADLQAEKCPPRPPPPSSSSSPAAGEGPAPPAAPSSAPAPTTTRPSMTTTASRPRPTTTTEPARRHRPRRHPRPAAGIRLRMRGGK